MLKNCSHDYLVLNYRSPYFVTGNWDPRNCNNKKESVQKLVIPHYGNFKKTWCWRFLTKNYSHIWKRVFDILCNTTGIFFQHCLGGVTYNAPWEIFKNPNFPKILTFLTLKMSDLDDGEKFLSFDQFSNFICQKSRSHILTLRTEKFFMAKFPRAQSSVTKISFYQSKQSSYSH